MKTIPNNWIQHKSKKLRAKKKQTNQKSFFNSSLMIVDNKKQRIIL